MIYKTLTLILATVITTSSICVAEQAPEQSTTQDSKPLIFRAYINGETKQCTLGSQFLDAACERNQTLKSSDPECFESSFIKNSKKSLQKLQDLGGVPLTIQDTHCTFFNRNSDTLLVLGTGFPVQRQRMLPFVKLFPNYNLLLFDYRGIGSDHHLGTSSYFLPWKWKGLLSWTIGQVDFNASGIGTLEEDEVITVVDACKKQKNYANVFGLGLCFSSYVFAKAAAKRTNLFDKLIFDGNWPSLERVIKTIIKDPSLLFTVETPHSPIPCLTHNEWFQTMMMTTIEWLTWKNLRTDPLSHYLSKITSPILFFQSLDDCYCDAKEFEEIWNAVKTPKAAVFTQNLHGRNHVWQAEAYKELAESFLDNSFDKFIAIST